MQLEKMEKEKKTEKAVLEKAYISDEQIAFIDKELARRDTYQGKALE